MTDVGWFTGLLVIVAWLQLLALNKTDQTLKIQQRAWLAPGKLTPPPAAQFFILKYGPFTPAVIDFDLTNSGKEPAVSVNQIIDFRFIENAWSEPGLTSAVSEILGGKTCDEIPLNRKSFAVFPGDTRHVLLTLTADQTMIALSRGHYTMVAGCLVYETVNEKHWSEFCRFLDPIDPNFSPGQTGFRTGVCPIYNKAD
ncbi:MAG: hypothetical protein ABSE22_18165 [Xanthobacteraceae bacterium]|jgi:hypothetical protein